MTRMKNDNFLYKNLFRCLEFDFLNLKPSLRETQYTYTLILMLGLPKKNRSIDTITQITQITNYCPYIAAILIIVCQTIF